MKLGEKKTKLNLKDFEEDGEGERKRESQFSNLFFGNYLLDYFTNIYCA